MGMYQYRVSGERHLYFYCHSYAHPQDGVGGLEEGAGEQCARKLFLIDTCIRRAFIPPSHLWLGGP